MIYLKVSVAIKLDYNLALNIPNMRIPLFYPWSVDPPKGLGQGKVLSPTTMIKVFIYTLTGLKRRVKKSTRQYLRRLSNSCLMSGDTARLPRQPAFPYSTFSAA